MAKGRGGRGPTRMDKRREADAVEARGKDDEKEEEVEEAEDESDDGDEDGDGKKKKAAKKKAVKKPAAPKKPAAKRTRTAKEVRRRATWVVFDNSNKPVGKFGFNERKEAEAHLAKKQEEKKGTFFINLIKEEITD